MSFGQVRGFGCPWKVFSSVLKITHLLNIGTVVTLHSIIFSSQNSKSPLYSLFQLWFRYKSKFNSLFHFFLVEWLWKSEWIFKNPPSFTSVRLAPSSSNSSVKRLLIFVKFCKKFMKAVDFKASKTSRVVSEYFFRSINANFFSL